MNHVNWWSLLGLRSYSMEKWTDPPLWEHALGHHHVELWLNQKQNGSFHSWKRAVTRWMTKTNNEPSCEAWRMEAEDKESKWDHADTYWRKTDICVYYTIRPQHGGLILLHHLFPSFFLLTYNTTKMVWWIRSQMQPNM